MVHAYHTGLVPCRTSGSRNDVAQVRFHDQQGAARRLKPVRGISRKVLEDGDTLVPHGTQGPVRLVSLFIRGRRRQR